MPTMKPSLFWRVTQPAITQILRQLSGPAIRATNRPFTAAHIMKPHVGGRRYGWTHYGVMIPALPDPLRYFSVMVLAGLPGATAFDNDDAVATTPRDTVTVSTSTAAPDAAFFRSYSMAEECRLESDGSHLAFGDDLVISGTFPDFTVSVRTVAFTAELRLHATGQVAWFARTPFYDHLSLLVQCEGEITTRGVTTQVSTVGTFEYAACAGLHALLDRPIHPTLKAPLDFFSYHVVAVDDRTQLLLVDVHAMGEPFATMAYHRSIGGPTWVVHNRDVRFEVTEYAAEVTTDPYGNPMRLPVSFRWTAGSDLVLTGTVDTPPRFGVGRGYIMGYRCEGRFQGREFLSRGYLEYVDSEQSDRSSK